MNANGKQRATVVTAADTNTIEAGPITIVPRLTAESGADFSVIEYTVGPGFVAPPRLHWHTRESTTFYLLEGSVRVELEDGPCELSAPAVLHLPVGAPFAWSNPGEQRARFLCMWSPAGFEGYFRELAEAHRAAGYAAPTPESMAKLIPPLWAKYGIQSD